MNKILSRVLLFFSLVALFCFLSPSTANAFEVRQGDQVNLPATETFDGSLFVAGQKLTINSRIDGDLYCAGQNVTITGEVTGDILCAAQNLNILGKVGGNIRSVAQTLSLDSLVGRNVNLFAQEISLGDKAKISGELYTAGQMVTVNGLVLKSWGGAAENITLNGRVDGDAQLAVENLVINKGATVSGGITRLERTPRTDNQRKVWKGSAVTKGFKVVGKVTGFAIGLLYGLLILWLFPAWLKRASAIFETTPGKSALWGLLIWLVTPVLIVLSAITIVGIPLALLLGSGLMLLCGLTWVVAANVVGSKLMAKKTKPIWSWLAGFLVISVVSWLPIIGGLVSLVVVLIGTGAIKHSLLSSKKK